MYDRSKQGHSVFSLMNGFTLDYLKLRHEIICHFSLSHDN